jgi:hypothetical protein
MSGLGLFKTGKQADEKVATLPYKSTVDYDALGGEGDGAIEQDDGDEQYEEDASTATTSVHIPIEIEEVEFPADKVKKTMKLLKYAVKPGASEVEKMAGITAIQKLANTTYAVRSELGERGVCEALCQLFESNVNDAGLVSEIIKAISFMLLSDDVNKVRASKLGGCRLTIETMRTHSEDASILELCCRLITDFGNGKFAAMTEAEFRRKEMQRDLRSREQKRKLLTAERIAAMSPTAAAAAKRAIEDLDEQESEEKSRAGEEKEASSKGTNTPAGEHPQDEEVWDNRLELCNVGACEMLVSMLHNLITPKHSHTMSAGEHYPLEHHRTGSVLTSIFEDEEVAVVACQAIASLAANSACARRFAKDGQLGKCLASLLTYFKYWNLMSASAWVVITLCADPKSGNKERLGVAGVGESLCEGLQELCDRYAEVGHINGFHKLVENYVWALLNLLIANQHNQFTLKSQDKDALFEQLLDARWVKQGIKEKVKTINKLLAKI